MLSCLLVAFYLCNPNAPAYAYAQSGSYAYAQSGQQVVVQAQPQVVYAAPVYAQPVYAQPVYPVAPIYPVVRLNFGGGCWNCGGHRGRW